VRGAALSPFRTRTYPIHSAHPQFLGPIFLADQFTILTHSRGSFQGQLRWKVSFCQGNHFFRAVTATSANRPVLVKEGYMSNTPRELLILCFTGHHTSDSVPATALKSLDQTTIFPPSSVPIHRVSRHPEVSKGPLPTCHLRDRSVPVPPFSNSRPLE